MCCIVAGILALRCAAATEQTHGQTSHCAVECLQPKEKHLADFTSNLLPTQKATTPPPPQHPFQTWLVTTYKHLMCISRMICVYVHHLLAMPQRRITRRPLQLCGFNCYRRQRLSQRDSDCPQRPRTAHTHARTHVPAPSAPVWQPIYQTERKSRCRGSSLTLLIARRQLNSLRNHN